MATAKPRGGFLTKVLITGMSGLIGGLLRDHLENLGGYQLSALNRSRVEGIKCTQADIGNIDGLLTGIAQGIAILPGISRSGLTLSSLLIRGFDRKDALTLSFLLGIPASIAVSIYGAASSETSLSASSLIAVFISFISGLITIKLMLNFAAKINFGAFVITVGILLTSSSLFSYFNTS